MKIYLLAFCFLYSFNLSAQCCSPGNPIGGTGTIGTLPKSALKFFLNYKYGYSGNYFEGGHKTKSDFIREGKYNFTGLNLAFGISDRMMLEAETGYMFDKTQYYAEGILPSRLTGKGLTDLTIGFKAAFIKNKDKEYEFTSGLGIKLPLSSNDQTYQGAVLPLDLQPSTGSTDFIHSLFIYKGFLKKHMRFFIDNRIEIKRQNENEYKYGNLFATSLFVTYSPSPHWIFILQARSEIRKRDERPSTGYGIQKENGRELVVPTGSQKIFVVPQVSYVFDKEWSVSLLADLPAYQYYNSKQLASSYALTLSISKQLQLQ